MIKTKKVIKGYEGFSLESFACEYCGQRPDETEIVSAYASSTYICGDIDCWNEYCLEWVWCGDTIEVEEEEIEVCNDCEEEDCCCEDGEQ
tara:strand:+ start:351 stop:620 length:270 start_codon:yes stop_codon:yes gene_type:complete